MKNIDLTKIKKAHFVGIGGIGVSAIARMMLAEGKKISGSDTSFSVITDKLQKLGAKVFLGHSADNVVDDVDLIVYTPAVNEENPELKKAKKLKITSLSYPEMLGLISKNKFTIAVSGAHGKTTTTAMIGKILIDAQYNPTIIVGSFLKDQNSNFVAGKGDYFVVEACEYKKSFLNLNPKIIVITNIDNDHLDYYGNLENIKKAFGEFAAKLDEKDYLICDPNNKNLKEIIKTVKTNIVDYKKITTNFNLKIPGKHNIKNAQVAVAVAKILNVGEKEAIKSLDDFSGTWRRFEHKGETKKGVLIYDDYSHHPTEIKATLKAAGEFFGKTQGKLWCVFQPHLYSRTKLLLNDFARSFNDADNVIVADIYAAREKNDKKITGKKLAEEIKKHNQNTRYLKSLSLIEKFLKKNTKKGDIVITMGAGDIYKIGENLLKN